MLGLWWEEVEGEGVEQVVVRVAGDPSHSLDTVFKFSSRWSKWCDSSLDRAPYPATVGLKKGQFYEDTWFRWLDKMS